MSERKDDKIPNMLDALVTCSMSEACRRAGVSRVTWWNYMVASAKGDERFQAIEWNGVVAPLHVQFQNAKALKVLEIEQSALEHAAHGFEQDVFFQGVRQHERVKRPEFANEDDEMLEILYGPEFESRCYHTVPTKQRLKPSDALVVKMLESHLPKRYGSKSTLDVRLGGVLRLDAPKVAEAATVEAVAVAFEEVEDDGAPERPQYLALATPAKTADEFEARAAAGEFDHGPVEVEDADGVVTVMTGADDKPTPKPDPLLRHPRAYMANTGERPPTPGPNYRGNDSSVGTGREGIGPGPDPHKVGGHQGFNVSIGARRTVR